MLDENEVPVENVEEEKSVDEIIEEETELDQAKDAAEIPPPTEEEVV